MEMHYKYKYKYNIKVYFSKFSTISWFVPIKRSHVLNKLVDKGGCNTIPMSTIIEKTVEQFSYVDYFVQLVANTI